MKDKQAGLGQPWNQSEDRHEDSGSREARQAGCGRAGGEGEDQVGEGGGQLYACLQGSCCGKSAL